ncbi:50S ribosomal protein L23 [Mesomycoplasma lagogenitalium]|uniref:Large ribosomal subunit protein uL23 n=1 Tax=Mesomycoplasma lagogenitalium TaxID=171286 RepID=A0ABY8LVY0_9BACT|nr:50S ribosomal protein L23 [Mesomycoplasma lagogenitalium]WGI36586.1 50S ribosomal protein L23 [Mesomycoplasma lagogenitalium]
MNINEIIKYPILTEKTYKRMNEGVYVFAVDKRVNKSEVKKAVEYIFDVKVEKVNIFNVPKRPTKLGRFNGFTKAFKRAIVKLEAGQQINILSEDTPVAEEAEIIKPQVQKDKKEMSDVEKKVAEKIAAKEKNKK